MATARIGAPHAYLKTNKPYSYWQCCCI